MLKHLNDYWPRNGPKSVSNVLKAISVTEAVVRKLNVAPMIEVQTELTFAVRMRQSKTIVTIGNRNPCVAVCNVTMPLARSRLEILQIRKLIQCVRSQDVAQIIKLIQMGIDGLVNYQGMIRGGV